ncbi:hypothetical protein K491DRAFT_697518 [Lophiostoma macrostomum CBS 122681]|uniref:BAH domain-containing protein n=1 Tax=Lophiostoma macrostomum CBS 122681 TaxID=1314788 RepID=A0A6A6ST63_9PLEO|nr:hypothetical protein K491DRAFT_697518 [Lophiostoma macrostomum CBS 122681]
MKTGHYVYVRPDKEQDNATIKGWIAKVLEVRAGDNAHVFLRVLWMYRPEDLPLGRQPYHGEHELIASNAMDVIDAQSVDGKAEVNYWDENEDSTIVLDPTKMFWRQTVDFWGKQKQKQSHTLSAVRRHCIERTPCNPDEGVIQCEYVILGAMRIQSTSFVAIPIAPPASSVLVCFTLFANRPLTSHVLI